MNAFIKFNRGVLKMPLHWQLWLVLLVTANGVSPLFFLQHVEAQAVLVGFLVSMTLMTLLTARFGFTRIVGLGHIVWVPLLAFLLTRFGDIPASAALGIWLRTLFVLNGISLVLDAADAIRYIAGERQETVAGL